MSEKTNETCKPIVFVIMPFNEDFYALYEELKNTFADDFDFINAGDLDNQQNIIKDIVEGIYKASVVIADVTGLNSNVFYELGLAHAMNKKVIIITQDINSLPFDIRSYRANEYSLKFYKLPLLKKELNKLLIGARDNTIQYGNPVADYAPQLVENISFGGNQPIDNIIDNDNQENSDEEDKGLLDYLSDINDNAIKMNAELSSMAIEIEDVNISITKASSDISRVKAQSGNLDFAFVRSICRKLSAPIDEVAQKLHGHVEQIIVYWEIVENGYLEILDNRFVQKKEDLEGLKATRISLIGMQNAIGESRDSVENFIAALRGSVGLERKLNKAILSLISELEAYLSLSDTMASSLERMMTKSDMVIEKLETND